MDGLQHVTYKCGCCGSSDLVEKDLSITGIHNAWMSISVGDYRFATVHKVRLCKQCGNIMPFVDPKNIVDNPLPWLT